MTPTQILVVAGPTAVGKSGLAVRLAERFGAEIIGADSRQVFREMDAGTAKPEPELRARVPHHLIDVASPAERFDVARWMEASLDVASEITGRGRRVIVCGGTGLYLRSLLRGLFEGPAADPELRAKLESLEAEQPGSLHARLAAVDAVTADRLHPNDQMRIVRALEVYESSGRPLSEWHREQAAADRPFASLTLELVADPRVLLERIEQRAAAIVEAGIVEELAGLRDRFGRDCRALNAIGYPEAGAVLDGDAPVAELPAAIALATRRYAKRQRTWLRGQESTQKVAFDRPDDAERLAGEFFS